MPALLLMFRIQIPAQDSFDFRSHRIGRQKIPDCGFPAAFCQQYGKQHGAEMAGNAGLGIVQIQVMGLEPVEERRLDGVTGYLLPQKRRGTRKISHPAGHFLDPGMPGCLEGRRQVIQEGDFSLPQKIRTLGQIRIPDKLYQRPCDCIHPLTCSYLPNLAARSLGSSQMDISGPLGTIRGKSAKGVWST